MEKIIQTLINSWTKGVDTYTHNGSTWLIFTDNKQWVIELTESKTLWYNYNFFKQIFEFTSLDVVDNQQYITKWVEENVINGVRYTGSPDWNRDKVAEDALKNGSIDCVRVNEHSLNYVSHQRDCEDTIENGIKETSHNATMFQSMKVEDTIQNGVKETITSENRSRLTAENIIENGVRHTIYPTEKPIFVVEDTIENGIKETRLEMNITEGEVDDIIQDGVKHTEIGWHQCNNIDDAIKKGVKLTQFNDNENKSWIEGVIKKGVRHTLNTEYMPTSMVEDIIQSGVKEIKGHGFEQQNIIDDIVKDGVKETSLKRGTRPFMVKDTIKNGVKETNPVDVMKFFDNKMEDALQNGIKETKTPGKDGDILSTIEWMKENKSNSYTKMIDDVIDYGEKINGTYAGGQRQSIKCKSVVEYGTKNPTV
jgi:hypothetical protein